MILEDVVVPIVVAVLAGGSAAAVTQVVLSRWRLNIEEDFAVRGLERETESARRQRLEEAHRNAADEHGDRVSAIYRHLNRISWDVIGDDLGMYDPESDGPVDVRDEAASAIRLLRELWTSHPTRSVRMHAKQLGQDLSNFYGEPPQSDRQWPSILHDRETLHEHVERADALVELLHGAPTERENSSHLEPSA